MQLSFFDFWLDPAFCDAKDLANLAFFGTTGALLGSELVGLSPAEIRALWGRFLEVDAERFQKAGVAPSIALGFPSEACPRRGWKELYLQIESLSSHSMVRAIGPLSLDDLPRHQEAFLAQLGLAAKRGLPCLIGLPQKGRLPYISKVISLAALSGVKPGRLAFLHCDGRSLVRAKTSGAFGVITVHPRWLRVDSAVTLLRRQGSQGALLASALGALPGDVLALPKVALGLSKAGKNIQEISAAAHQNAIGFLGLTSL